MRILAALGGISVLLFSGVAFADPCTAPLLTREGAQFSGIVRYVGDGDSLCVGPANSGGASWVEVRLMDFSAPERGQPGGREATRALRAFALGQPVECVVTRGRTGNHSFDRTHAVCTVRGQRIGDALRAAGVREGGN